MIVFDSVYKSFGKQQVLRGLSFAANDGRVTGFVGHNGSGKTTSFKILLGLLPSDGGTAKLNDSLYKNHLDPGGAVGAYLGPQHIPGSMTGRSFLSYTADLLGVDRESGYRYLQSVGLGAEADKKISQYSLGMRQRLGVAAAFIGEPQNLVLDEPVNGLDVEGVRWLREYLRSAADQGRCVLLSSHLLSELEIVADDVVMLKDGKVSHSGAVAGLKAGALDIVEVASDDNQSLASYLEENGLAVQLSSDAIIVMNATVNHVAGIAAQSSVSLRSISRLTKRLEDVYLEQGGSFITEDNADGDAL